MLVRGVAGALDEIHHRHRDVDELGAGAPGGLHVALAQLRVPGDLAFAVAAHEGEIQRPPGQAQQRHPEQLALEEEAQQRDAPVEHLLQHQDVHPALVVGQYQVVAIAAQIGAGVQLHVEAGIGERAHHRRVDRDPALGQAGQQRVAGPAHGGKRQHRLDHAQHHHRYHVDQAVGCNQQQDEGDTQPGQHGHRRGFLRREARKPSKTTAPGALNPGTPDRACGRCRRRRPSPPARRRAR